MCAPHQTEFAASRVVFTLDIPLASLKATPVNLATANRVPMRD